MQSTGFSMGSLRRGCRRGIHQLTRDRNWTITLALLSAVMALVQLLFIFFLSVQAVSAVLIGRSAVYLEVQNGATEARIQELYAELRANPAISNVEYITATRAYELQRTQDPDLIAFLEEYDLENPFPDTFAVTLKSSEQYNALAAEIQRGSWSDVINPSYLSTLNEEQDNVHTLLEVSEGIKTMSIVLMAIAFAVLLFVIIEWVSRTAARRGNELLLEHIIGAEPIAVLLPFAFEMAVLLLAAVLVGTLAVGLFGILLPMFMRALALEASFAALQMELYPLLLHVLPILLVIELLAMPILAFIGTVLGIRKNMPDTYTLSF